MVRRGESMGRGPFFNHKRGVIAVASFWLITVLIGGFITFSIHYPNVAGSILCGVCALAFSGFIYYSGGTGVE